MYVRVGMSVAMYECISTANTDVRTVLHTVLYEGDLPLHDDHGRYRYAALSTTYGVTWIFNTASCTGATTTVKGARTLVAWQVYITIVLIIIPPTHPPRGLKEQNGGVLGARYQGRETS